MYIITIIINTQTESILMTCVYGNETGLGSPLGGDGGKVTGAIMEGLKAEEQEEEGRKEEEGGEEEVTEMVKVISSLNSFELKLFKEEPSLVSAQVAQSVRMCMCVRILCTSHLWCMFGTCDTHPPGHPSAADDETCKMCPVHWVTVLTARLEGCLWPRELWFS